MITYSIIQKSKLEGALRLDAEYYQPEYLILDEKIKNQNTKLLKDIGEIVYGTTPEGGIFEQKGIPFVRSQNFSNLLLDTFDLVFCSEKFHNQNKKSEIKPGDILFAAVGATIGKLAVVQNEIDMGNINQNIARVRIIKKNINPYFVGLFFASRPGQLQIERLVTGNAQFYLNSEQIGSFIVPDVDIKQQNKIAKYFKEIQGQMQDSESLYHQAETLLLEELNLKDFEAKNSLSSVVNLSEILEFQRMDAEYFQPKYKNLIEHIRKNCNGVPLGELVSVKKGIEPGAESYQTEGRQFIRVSSMSKYGINDNDQKYLTDDLYNELKNGYEPKKGEILLTKDASPGVAYVLKDDMEGIISGGVLRLKLNPSASSGQEKIEDEYLALCLNSVIGQMQAERDAGGSVIMHWKPEQIKNVMIPILSKQTQQKISSLVRESFEKRIKVKELLEEAKRKVEEMIEKN
jgi:restriction endonuclease S subunit